jgi:hypothetical protein
MNLFQSISKKGNVLVVAAALLVSGMALAEGKRGADTRSTDTGGNLMWFGASTNNLMLNTPTPAISILLRVTPKFDIQSYFILNSVSPNFGIAGGGVAKFTVIGTADKGFHLGAGFGLGEQGNGFFANFAGLAGVHFEVLNGVLISMDTGMRLRVGGGAEDFAIAGASDLLGLSIHLAL